jgi:hypothetical protein
MELFLHSGHFLATPKPLKALSSIVQPAVAEEPDYQNISVQRSQIEEHQSHQLSVALKTGLLKEIREEQLKSIN